MGLVVASLSHRTVAYVLSADEDALKPRGSLFDFTNRILQRIQSAQSVQECRYLNTDDYAYACPVEHGVRPDLVTAPV